MANKPTKQMAWLKLIADERSYVIEDDPGDGSPYSGYREDSLELRMHGLRRVDEVVTVPEDYSLDCPSKYADLLVDLPVAIGDIFHIVIVRYSTGGTFSRTNGDWAVAGIFKNPKDAVELSRRIEADKDKKDDYTVPWKGYFERFESVDVHFLMVKE